MWVTDFKGGALMKIHGRGNQKPATIDYHSEKIHCLAINDRHVTTNIFLTSHVLVFYPGIQLRLSSTPGKCFMGAKVFIGTL